MFEASEGPERRAASMVLQRLAVLAVQTAAEGVNAWEGEHHSEVALMPSAVQTPPPWPAQHACLHTTPADVSQATPKCSHAEQLSTLG